MAGLAGNPCHMVIQQSFCMGLCIMAVGAGQVILAAGRNHHGITLDLMIFGGVACLAGKIQAISTHVHIMLPGRRHHG